MSKPLQKSLQDYLSKMKKRRTYSHKFRVASRVLSSSSKKKILRACKRLKTRSIVVGDSAATLADVDQFLFENFKSLYIKDDEEGDKSKKFEKNDQGGGVSSPDEEKTGGIWLESPRFIDPPPNLCGSNRFFVSSASSGSLISKSSTVASEDKGSSSPFLASRIGEKLPRFIDLPPDLYGSSQFFVSSGSSESLITKSSTIASEDRGSSSTSSRSRIGGDDVITVLKYSPSPYNDFRISMEEMIEARLKNHPGRRVDWEFMEELLHCYLDLNEKKSHKYILSAFVELIVVLRENRRKVLASASDKKNNPSANASDKKNSPSSVRTRY